MKIHYAVSIVLFLTGCATTEQSTTCNETGAVENRTKAGIYFRDNLKIDGVVELKNGLQYTIVREGYGDIKPDPNSTVVAHYETRLLDGTVIDSSYKRGNPIHFKPSEMILGWSIVLSQMVEGEIRTVYLQPKYAYGCRAQPPKIGYDESLIFDIELIKII